MAALMTLSNFLFIDSSGYGFDHVCYVYQNRFHNTLGSDVGICDIFSHVLHVYAGPVDTSASDFVLLNRNFCIRPLLDNWHPTNNGK